MSEEIGSTAPAVEQDALNEEQPVATMENAANSPRNDIAGNLVELHEKRSRDGSARAIQNPAASELSGAPNRPAAKGKKPAHISRRKFFTKAGIAAASLPFLGLRESVAQEVFDADKRGLDREPLVIRKQGSFMAGGSVISNSGTFDPFNPTPAGQTFHGDHAYAFYQIPVDARDLPLVLWHGGGQFSKTWETTPDGREGYQNIFLRRGFGVYVIDHPRRGDAGRSTQPITITPTPGEQAAFDSFRLGIWPNFFPGVQFSHDPEALNQYWRQQTPDTGPFDIGVVTDGVAALFNRIGPAILLTHSQSGGLGWRTAIKSQNVRAIVAYEPGSNFIFPDGEVPPPMPSSAGPLTALGAPLSEFMLLTKIPIRIFYGDNIPETPTANPGQDMWRTRVAMARLWRDAVNRRGGDVSIVHLPDIGIYGNTHFAFSDLNSLQIADLLSQYLNENGLDGRRHQG